MFRFLFVLSIVFSSTLGLYEDQAGKFDWYQQYLGKIKYFFIEKQSVPSRRIIFSSESNVHAALNLYSGNIEWRQHLKEDELILSIDYCKNHLISLVNVPSGTVMRVWDTILGTILWEKQITETETNEAVIKCHIDSDNIITLIGNNLYSIKLKNGLMNWIKEISKEKNTYSKTELHLLKSMDLILIERNNNNQIDLHIFNTTGEVIQIPQLPSTQFNSIIECGASISNNMYFCIDLSTSQLHVLNIHRNSSHWTSTNIDLPFTNSKKYHSMKILSSEKFMVVSTDNDIVDNNQSIYMYNIAYAYNERIQCKLDFIVENIKIHSLVEQDGKLNFVIMKYFHDRKIKNVEINFIDLNDGQEMKQLTTQYTLHKHHGSPIQMEPVLFRKKDSALAYRIFLVTMDNALHFWNQNGNVFWMREESLANVVAAEMLDLPVSDTEAKMDEEFGHNQDNVIQKFIKRISTQLSQLKYFIQEQLKQSKTSNTRYYSKERPCQAKNSFNCRSDEESSDNLEMTNGDNNTSSEPQSSIAMSLRRDSFNLHKMLVLTTASGKIFGLESSTGQIVWRYLIHNAIPFSKNRVQLFILRTTAHFPHPPQAVLLMRCKKTGNPLLFTFNPITGSPQKPDLQVLNYRIYQATMLPLPVSEENVYSKPVLILDRDLKVHIFPFDYRLSLNTYPIYIYRIDDELGYVVGYEVKRINFGQCSSKDSNDHDCYVAYEIWKLNFSPHDQKIAAVAFKSSIEQVHSVGRILSDRNVLYKYLNPNLLSLVTESNNSSNPNCAVTLYLIDVVTGKIVYSTVHRKAGGPINLVQSENWIVYSFQNFRSHRTEIAVLELYEPYEIPDSIIYEIKDVDIEQLKRSIKLNKNDVGSGFDILSILGGERATTKKFSSKQRSRIESSDDNVIIGPVVLKQGYIVSTYIRRASVSITEKGITSKSILLALETGGIMELPKALLDPRRNLIMSPELLEEGVEPYMPEIPIRTFNIINYNQSVARVKNIYAGPSGLESTSLVFAYGLDLFFTQIAPSKMYDILKEDFDYVFIATVTVGMIIGAFVTQRLAARRALYRSWQ